MTFSQYAGSAIVPTLSRLVLAAAFTFAGYGKVFTTAEFNEKQAARLNELGVTVTPKTTRISAAAETGHEQFMLAAYRQETPPAAAPQPTAGEKPEPKPDAKPAATPPETATTIAVTPGVFTASMMHHITLMVDNAGWPYPVWEARAAAYTELIGGILLFVGLLSRLWGLGLACVMGVAFYFTSLPVLKATPIMNIAPIDFNTLFVQMSLFVLAFGVMLTGAGPLSLDRMLFGRADTVPVPKPPK